MSIVILYTLALILFLYIHAGVKTSKKLSYIEYKALRTWDCLDTCQKKISLSKIFKLETHELNDQLLNDKFSERLRLTILANKKEKDADISALKQYLFNGLTPS